MSDEIHATDGEIDVKKSEAYKHELRAERSQLALNVIKTGGIYLCLLASLIGIWLIRDTQNNIESCTDPSGKCYQDGQKQTSRVLGLVSEDNKAISIYASVCALDLLEKGKLNEDPSKNVIPISKCIDQLIVTFGRTDQK